MKGDHLHEAAPPAPGRPPRVPWLLRVCARAILKLCGWKFQADAAAYRCPQFVLVAAPHTSNWDAVWGALALMALDIGVSIIFKQEWMRVPLIGWGLSALGAVGVDRSGGRNTVTQLVRLFERHPRFVLTITPEGTRRKSTYWKSGFYYVAQQAGVPILLASVDYRRKIGAIAPVVVTPTGNIEADMTPFRPILESVTPRYPRNQTEMRFETSAEHAGEQS